MPPKEKFGKKELLEAGLLITRKDGFENVNARSIAKALSCSTHPLFRVFTDMEDFKASLFQYAADYCGEYLSNAVIAYPQRTVFGMGMSYIDFAAKEPNLFRFLFMSNQFTKKQAELLWESENNSHIIREMAARAGIDFDAAKQLFRDLWLYTHGIAALSASNGEYFAKDELERMLMDVYTGFLLQIKSKENSDE